MEPQPKFRSKRDIFSALSDGMNLSTDLSEGNLFGAMCYAVKVFDGFSSDKTNFILKFITNALLWLCTTLHVLP